MSPRSPGSRTRPSRGCSTTARACCRRPGSACSTRSTDRLPAEPGRAGPRHEPFAHHRRAHRADRQLRPVDERSPRSRRRRREAGYRLSIASLDSSDYESIVAALDYLLTQAVEAIVVIAPQVRVLEAITERRSTVPLVTLQSTERGCAQPRRSTRSPARAWRPSTSSSSVTREILHIAGPQDWIEAEARMQGYLDELDDADLRTRAPILGDWTARLRLLRRARAAARPRLHGRVRGNDQMALGLITPAATAGSTCRAT